MIETILRWLGVPRKIEPRPNRMVFDSIGAEREYWAMYRRQISKLLAMKDEEIQRLVEKGGR